MPGRDLFKDKSPEYLQVIGSIKAAQQSKPQGRSLEFTSLEDMPTPEAKPELGSPGYKPLAFDTQLAQAHPMPQKLAPLTDEQIMASTHIDPNWKRPLTPEEKMAAFMSSMGPAQATAGPTE